MRRQSFHDDERAIAAVVGFVLILAVAIGYYAYVAKQDVPRWGAQNERAWDDAVGTAMEQLTRDTYPALTSGASVVGSVPKVPQPQAFDVPLLGRTEPVPPDGVLSFSEDCRFDATFTTASPPGPPQMQALGSGCLTFDAQPVYASPFAFAIENGVLLRVQGTDAIIAHPPLIKFQTHTANPGANISARLDVTTTLAALVGSGASASIDKSDVPIDLTQTGSSHTTSYATANANELSFTIATHHATAWATWFQEQFADAGINDPSFCTTMPTTQCATAVANVQTNPQQVSVTIQGPFTGHQALDNDILFNWASGSSFTVTLR
jgi:hypothetical protein